MSISSRNVKILQKLKSHTSDVTTCDFAPNFTLVTGSSDKSVGIWDWVPGSGYVQRENSPLRGHKYQVTCVRVSPQGSMMASTSVDGTAILWSLYSLNKLYTMAQVNGDAIRVCRFAPDSSVLVTAGDNGAVCIWDLVHRSLIRTLFEHEGTTQSLSFTPDSQYLVTACSLEVIRVWYVQSLVDTTSDTACVPLARFDNAHDMGVFCLDISKQVTVDENNPLIKYYKMATSGNSNEIKIWTITSRATPKHADSTNEVSLDTCDTYNGHSSSVTCIKYSNNGLYLVSSSVDKTVKIWNNNGGCVANLIGHKRYVNCAAMSKDCLLIASGSTGSNDKLVFIWDLTGEISKDSELFYRRLSGNSFNGAEELRVVQNAEAADNEIKFIEKMDDISEGSINSCSFNGSDMLATASGDKLVRIFKVLEENSNIEELSYSPLEGHTYAVNYVEFSKNGSMLASCSLDGCTIIWNPDTGENTITLPQNSLSIKVCRFSVNSVLLITAGDDDNADVWSTDSMEKVASLQGHLDAVTGACFSPDDLIIATSSANSDFRLWLVEDFSPLYICEDAHGYGTQNCDFSSNLVPIPNAPLEPQSYLLATCGNDGLAKLWRITVPKKTDHMEFNKIEVKTWRQLKGHGGDVICVRFSPSVSEIVCSSATDRQARIWSVYSAECLFVLDHDSIVTACCFSSDCSLLATGCLDKTLWLWKLPQQLIFQAEVANKIKCRRKAIIDWTTADVLHWLHDINMDEIAENVTNTSLDGQKLLSMTEDEICSGMDLNDEQTDLMVKEIKWLKQSELQLSKPENVDIPFEFVCPITHEIMREPVTCSDGFTYEKNAISEWLMSGKSTSPMTNEKLEKTDFTFNLELRNQIHDFLEATVNGNDE